MSRPAAGQIRSDGQCCPFHGPHPTDLAAIRLHVRGRGGKSISTATASTATARRPTRQSPLSGCGMSRRSFWAGCRTLNSNPIPNRRQTVRRPPTGFLAEPGRSLQPQRQQPYELRRVRQEPAAPVTPAQDVVARHAHDEHLPRHAQRPDPAPTSISAATADRDTTSRTGGAYTVSCHAPGNICRYLSPRISVGLNCALNDHARPRRLGTRTPIRSSPPAGTSNTAWEANTKRPTRTTCSSGRAASSGTISRISHREPWRPNNVANAARRPGSSGVQRSLVMEVAP